MGTSAPLELHLDQSSIRFRRSQETPRTFKNQELTPYRVRKHHRIATTPVGAHSQQVAFDVTIKQSHVARGLLRLVPPFGAPKVVEHMVGKQPVRTGSRNWLTR